MATMDKIIDLALFLGGWGVVNVMNVAAILKQLVFTVITSFINIMNETAIL